MSGVRQQYSSQPLRKLVIFLSFGLFCVFTLISQTVPTRYIVEQIEDVTIQSTIENQENPSIIQGSMNVEKEEDDSYDYEAVFCSNFMDSKDPLKLKIQLNTLKRFTTLDPKRIKFVLFTQSEYWTLQAKKLNIEVSTEFTSNQYGTPYFFPMLEYIESNYKSHFYGFLNGDILLHSSIIDILRKVWNEREGGKLKNKLMITGRRNNMYISLSINIGTNSEEMDMFIKNNVFKNEQFLPVSQDYFIITKGTFDYKNMFPVVIGRNDYDNYLVDYCYHHPRYISLIDGSTAIIALHQTESHGNFAGERVNPDKTWNHDLIGKHHEYDSVLFANWRIYATTTGNYHILPTSPYDDNYTPKELSFLQTHLPLHSHCFFLGAGYISGKISSICDTAEIVYYDKCKKINKTITRPPMDINKYHEAIRIIDVYNKTMRGDCSRYHFYFDRLKEIGDFYDIIFIEGDSLVVFRGYNIQKYDYNNLQEEAYHKIFELSPVESLYSLDIQGIRIYKYIPNKYITTKLPI
ncbi:hypothetical protein WA158_008209 [Blastocystis sp. Blastoise]